MRRNVAATVLEEYGRPVWAVRAYGLWALTRRVCAGGAQCDVPAAHAIDRVGKEFTDSRFR
jgi:hypothetical protein